MKDSLIIQNFKCFIHQEIAIQRLTVLAGSNSAGKSSVIQSLLLLRLAHEKIMTGIYKIPLNGEYALGLGNSSNIINQSKPSEQTVIKFRHNNLIEEVDFFADIKDPQVFLNIKNPKKNPLTNPSQTIHIIGLSNFHYLNAERLGPRQFYSVTEVGRNVGCQGENTISLLSSSSAGTPEYDVAKERMFTKTENPRLIRQVQDWMNHIIPGIEIDPKKIQEANLSYVQYGGSTPHNVGFGVSYVLPIVVAGLIAQKNEMLIVENPEAHLHPSGQSAIGRFLAKVAGSGINVVIETHSEHVINGIRIASIDGSIPHNEVVVNFFFKNEHEEVNLKSIDINTTGDLTSYPKGFFDQQQRDFAEIVTQKRKIIK